MASKRIGILTGGGDVPGLNSVIKTVVYRASEMGAVVIGIRRGWEGLTHLNLDEPSSRALYLAPLNRENTRTIDRTGGTFLHSSRTNPAKMKRVPGVHVREFPPRDGGQGAYDMTPQVLKKIEALGLECLIAIGGDETLGYAGRLHREGVQVIAIPKAMDNNVRNTEYCIGFSTAVTRATEAIERQRTTIGSHERIGIFRILGRRTGYTALFTAYVTSLRCCIPEYRFDLPHLIGLVTTDKRNNPSNYALLIVSEGAEWVQSGDAAPRRSLNVAEDLSEAIRRQTGEEAIVSDLTYDLRSGSPDFVDKMVANTFAGMAIDCLTNGTHGVMTAITGGCYTTVPIPDSSLGPRQVDVETLYNTERYRPRYDHKSGLPLFLTCEPHPEMWRAAEKTGIEELQPSIA